MLYRKTTLRSFTTHTILQIDAKNGYELDRTQEITDHCKGDKKLIEEYFATKEQSIREAYRNDSNSAAASGTDAQELDQWLKDRDRLLRELPGQKDDVFDLSPDRDNDEDNTMSEGFKQDSSDIQKTDFTSYEDYEE